MNKKELLKKYISENDYIFIDSCSFLSERRNEFFAIYSKYVKESPNYVHTCIMLEVVEEMRRLSKNKGNPELAKKALEALKLIKYYDQEVGLFTAIGRREDVFADVRITNAIAETRLKGNVLLITEDKNLQKDTLSLNSLKSQKSFFKVSVASVDKDFDFSIKDVEITRLDETKINTRIPKSGEMVYARNQRGGILLGSQVGMPGREGTCYDIGGGVVCKIFNAENLRVWRRDKIQFMLDHPIKNESICWPIDMVTNGEEFVGYLMPKIENALTLEHITTDMNDTERIVQNKLNMVLICKELVSAFEVLHEQGIIVGDISPRNILIKNNGIYLIDMDSVQIGRFPCTTFTDEYVAPEYINNSGDGVNIPKIRSVQSEVIEIAILLVQMLIGINPYNIINPEKDDLYYNYDGAIFPYPIYAYKLKGDYTNAPQGPNRQAWDHLPFKLKTAISSTFAKNRSRNKEGARFSMSDWRGMLSDYERYLRYVRPDSEALKLFPKDFCSIEELQIQDQYYQSSVNIIENAFSNDQDINKLDVLYNKLHQRDNALDDKLHKKVIEMSSAELDKIIEICNNQIKDKNEVIRLRGKYVDLKRPSFDAYIRDCKIAKQISPLYKKIKQTDEILGRKLSKPLNKVKQEECEEIIELAKSQLDKIKEFKNSNGKYIELKNDQFSIYISTYADKVRELKSYSYKQKNTTNNRKVYSVDKHKSYNENSKKNKKNVNGNSFQQKNKKNNVKQQKAETSQEKKARDNRANQMNPNNPEYKKSHRKIFTRRGF